MKTLFLPMPIVACFSVLIPGGAFASEPHAREPERVPLEAVMHAFEMEPAEAKIPRVAFRHGQNKLAFQPGSRRLEFNESLMFLNAEISGTSNAWFMAKTDVESVLKPLLSPVTRLSGIQMLVIDPGHGGSDCGATSHLQTTEKVLALDIAQRIRRRFRASGIRVRFTRTGDRALTLQERAERARDLKGSVFVSIHLNSAPNKAASGYETFVLPAHGFPSTSGGTNGEKACIGNRHDADNTRLAYLIHKGLGANIQAPDRGIRRARFKVLCDAPCPAVLVECGFLSNQAEAELLGSIDHREAIAEGISQGLFTYFRGGTLESSTQTSQP